MGFFKWMNETFGECCDECGEALPSSTLITMSGYDHDGVFCAECAREIIKELRED